MEARYDERIRNCKSADELADYLLMCVPVIREYTGINAPTVSTTKTVANLQIGSRTGVKRKDIYQKYLKEVEDQDQCNEKKCEIDVDPCKNC